MTAPDKLWSFCCRHLGDLTPSQRPVVGKILSAIQEIASQEIKEELKFRRISSTDSRAGCYGEKRCQQESVQSSVDTTHPYKDYDDWINRHNPPNVFVINGSRGTGKTTVLLTLHRWVDLLDMGQGDKGLIHAVLGNAISREDAIKMGSDWERLLTTPPLDSDTGRKTAYVLPVIFPDKREVTEHAVLEGIFAHMETALCRKAREGTHFSRDPLEADRCDVVQLECDKSDSSGTGRYDDEQREDRRGSRRKRAKQLLHYFHTSVVAGWTFAQKLGLETLSRDSLNYSEFIRDRSEQSRVSHLRATAWNRFVTEFLNLFECELLAVFVDDSDLTPETSTDLFNCLRVYLAHPRMVTVLAMEQQAVEMHMLSQRTAGLVDAMKVMETFSAIMEKDFRNIQNGMKPLLSEAETRSVRNAMKTAMDWRETIREETLEYLRKLLPAVTRYDLPPPTREDRVEILSGMFDDLPEVDQKDRDERIVRALLREYHVVILEGSSARAVATARELVRTDGKNLKSSFFRHPMFDGFSQVLPKSLPLWQRHTFGFIKNLLDSRLSDLRAYALGDEQISALSKEIRPALFLMDIYWAIDGLLREPKHVINPFPYHILQIDIPFQDNTLLLGLAGQTPVRLLPRNCLYFQDLLLALPMRIELVLHMGSPQPWGSKYLYRVVAKANFADLTNLLRPYTEDRLAQWNWLHKLPMPGNPFDPSLSPEAVKGWVLFFFRWYLIAESIRQPQVDVQKASNAFIGALSQWGQQTGPSSDPDFLNFVAFLDKAHEVYAKQWASHVVVKQAMLESAVRIASQAEGASPLGNRANRQQWSINLIQWVIDELPKMSTRRALLLAWALLPLVDDTLIQVQGAEQEKLTSLLDRLDHKLKPYTEDTDKQKCIHQFPDMEEQILKILETVIKGLESCRGEMALILKKVEAAVTDSDTERERRARQAQWLECPVWQVDRFILPLEKVLLPNPAPHTSKV